VNINERRTMTVNEKIFDLMEKKNIKYADLARYLDVRNNVITNWYNRGTEPPIKYIVPICELLGVSIYELLDIQDCTDKKILDAYYAASPGTQEAVRKLLDIPEDQDEKLLSSKIG
jgi:transcriptional regulator with XRE-family HTH domain